MPERSDGDSMTDLHGIELRLPLNGAAELILTDEALAFVAHLHRTFNPLVPDP